MPLTNILYENKESKHKYQALSVLVCSRSKNFSFKFLIKFTALRWMTSFIFYLEKNSTLNLNIMTLSGKFKMHVIFVVTAWYKFGTRKYKLNLNEC